MGHDGRFASFVALEEEVLQEFFLVFVAEAAEDGAEVAAAASYDDFLVDWVAVGVERDGHGAVGDGVLRGGTCIRAMSFDKFREI